MTSQLSAPPKSSQTLGELTDRQRLLSLPDSATGAVAVRAATNALLKMAAVGLTEDMAGFERVLAARWPQTFAPARASGADDQPAAGAPAHTPGAGCRIPSGSEARNPTSRHAATLAPSTELDEATRKAISDLNRLDMSLYAAAREIAHAQASCAAGTMSPTLRLPNEPLKVRRMDKHERRGSSEVHTCFEETRRRLSLALGDHS